MAETESLSLFVFLHDHSVRRQASRGGAATVHRRSFYQIYSSLPSLLCGLYSEKSRLVRVPRDLSPPSLTLNSRYALSTSPPFFFLTSST